MRRTVWIMVGLPASGKSTIREKVIEGHDSFRPVHVYSTDDLIDAYAEANDSTYSDVFDLYVKTAQETADRQLQDAISQGESVLWDQTNMNRKKRRKILNQFGNDWGKKCICFLPPFTEEQEVELQRRLDSREDKTIPSFVMAGMRRSFQLPSTNEGFNRVEYYDIYGNSVDRNVAAEMFGSK